MGTPYLGEVRIVSFNFAPRGWALCNGQTLPINQNQALFALFGTIYGGNGQTTFALPNLQGRAPIHFGGGFDQGQAGGEVNHTLTVQELPGHNHTPQGVAANAAVASPAGAAWATTTLAGNEPFAAAANGAMAAGAIQAAGGGQSHANLQPYLVLSFIVALQGIFPSRN